MINVKANITILIVSCFIYLSPASVLAAGIGGVCKTMSECTEGACVEGVCQAVAKISDFETLFSNIISIAGLLAGFGFFLMMVMGGIRLLMSAGDPKAVAAAKGTITWAIIGLAIFALSFTILLLIEAFTGIPLTIFKITI